MRVLVTAAILVLAAGSAHAQYNPYGGYGYGPAGIPGAAQVPGYTIQDTTNPVGSFYAPHTYRVVPDYTPPSYQPPPGTPCYLPGCGR